VQGRHGNKPYHEKGNDMESKASQEREIDKHLRMQRDISFTVEFLKKFGGSDLHFNQYGNTILHLDGVQKGMRMADNAHERIQFEKNFMREV
jgi:hypothetical protein